MDLERSLANITIDEGPWRQHDTQQGWAAGGGGGMSAGGAGVVGPPGGGSWNLSPQQSNAMRNVWQDPQALAQNVNEALGLGGAGGGGGGWAAADDFGGKTIWGEGGDGGAPGGVGGVPPQHMPPQAAAPYQQHHMHAPPQPHRGGMMNGVMDGGAGDWGMRGGADPSGGGGGGGVWSDPLKPMDQDAYWKVPGGGGAGGWPGAAMGPPRGGGGGGWPGAPPPQQQPQHMAPHHMARGGAGQQMHMRGAPPHHGGWRGDRGGQQMGGGGGGMVGKQMPWEQQAPPMQFGGGYPPRMMQPRGGAHRFDVTVPPPIDMPGMGMRGPPPGAGAQMWKPDGGMGGGMMGGGGGGRGNGYGPPMGHFVPQQHPRMDGGMGKYGGGGGGGSGGGGSDYGVSGGGDDLMWHDPNGELKKWQRDTGVSIWGDPDKACQRAVKNWTVSEGDEEDLEQALSKCPVPQKKGEDGQPRVPFPIPPKRAIVETGWGELPDNDPNNPVKDEASGAGKWSSESTGGGGEGGSSTPWWPHAGGAGASGGGGAFDGLGEGGQIGQGSTEAIAEQLRRAVEKNYLDISILQQRSLPPPIINQINALLAKIPALEQAEAELSQLVAGVQPPEGEESGSGSPQRWMSEVQKVEHNRLIIEVTTARIEVSELSKKIGRALSEERERAGLPPAPPPPQTGGAAADEYNYSFLQ